MQKRKQNVIQLTQSSIDISDNHWFEFLIVTFIINLTRDCVVLFLKNMKQDFTRILNIIRVFEIYQTAARGVYFFEGQSHSQSNAFELAYILIGSK